MSFEFMQAFKFIQMKTIIHNLDPRTKLLLAIIYSILAIMFEEIFILLFIFLTLFPFIFTGQLFKKWIKSIRGMSFLFLLLIIFNTLFSTFSKSISMIIRIMIMVSSFSLFFLTVHPDDLMLSLLSLKVPYNIAFSFSLSFRFVPTIAIEAQNIIDAQKSRGYEMEQGGVISQAKNLIPLLIPLIVCSMKRAFYVAESLDSRAFGSTKNRTYYYSISYTKKDWLITLILFTFFVFGIIIKIFPYFLPNWFNWKFPV